MKIAYIVGSFPHVSETFILNQVTGLLALGNEVDVYADMMADDSDMRHVFEVTGGRLRIYRRPRLPRGVVFRLVKALALIMTNFHKGPLLILRSLNFLRYGRAASSLHLFYDTVACLGQPRRYDAIHCHFGTSGIRGMWLRKIGALRGKLITTFHGFDATKYVLESGSHVYDQLFEEGDLFLPISEFLKNRLVELGCQRDKIVVHRMGVDCSKFMFKPRMLRTDKHVHLISIARLVEKKGLEYAIRAIGKMVGRGLHIEYQIVGDGPLRRQLEELVKRESLTDVVHILGWRSHDEVVHLLDEAHILLAPSVTGADGDQEGIPVVLMEAMAQGLPVVSTLHSGIPELVEDSVSGFLVPERDIDGLAKKLRYLIEHPHLWPEFGRRGRECVEKNHNIEVLNSQLVEIFQGKRLNNNLNAHRIP
jgi:colanic acid/amylovoran biosynthesis glycosyltransferase